MVGGSSLYIKIARILHGGLREWKTKLLKLLKFRLRTGTVLFLLYSVGQSKLKSSQDSRGGKTGSTSQWEELHMHTGLGHKRSYLRPSVDITYHCLPYSHNNLCPSYVQMSSPHPPQRPSVSSKECLRCKSKSQNLKPGLNVLRCGWSYSDEVPLDLETLKTKRVTITTPKTCQVISPSPHTNTPNINDEIRTE